MDYLTLKLIHIIAAVIVAGTGTGIAFFMLMAFRSKDPQAIKIVTRYVVLADWIFTTPAVIIQLLSGILLMNVLGYSFASPWFTLVILLFIFIGCCWIPVIVIQYRLRDLASSHQAEFCVDSQFSKLMKYWIALGVPAFISILILFWLMVFKPLETF